MSDKKVTRREFVADAGKLALGGAVAAQGFPMIVPRHVLGGAGYQAPSDTVNIAVIGLGGMGGSNAFDVARTDNIVAVADVDMAYSQRQVDNRTRPRQDGTVNPDAIKLKDQFTKAAKYADFREMLDKQKDIDGVVIATPDHIHAVAAKAAMDRGKHVYVQKPLTWSVYEARVLGETARKNKKLVTQMGNQGHSGDGARLINEWVQAGVIGPVREVYVWTNRPLGYWPQGVPRPSGGDLQTLYQLAQRYGTSWSQGRINQTIAAMMGSYPVPEGLRWDLYLGPVKDDIPYHPIYHPFNWRGWIDFGMGALGDMGAHLIDHPFWALGLRYPTSIEATSSPWGMETIPGDPKAAPGTPAARPQSKPASYPLATTVHYQFGARDNQPPVKLFWSDGGLYPPRPDVLPDNITLESEGGVIFVGDKGILINDTYGENPRVYPESLQSVANAVPRTIPRIAQPGEHDLSFRHVQNWLHAIRGNATASSPLEYAAQLTETMLLGVVALRTGQGRKLLYDGERMQVTNIPEANQYLKREFRAGWAI